MLPHLAGSQFDLQIWNFHEFAIVVAGLQRELPGSANRPLLDLSRHVLGLVRGHLLLRDGFI